MEEVDWLGRSGREEVEVPSPESRLPAHWSSTAGFHRCLCIPTIDEYLKL